MNQALQQTLEAGGVAICVKSADKRVLSQNDHCRTICGDRQGEQCTVGCMELYARDETQQWKDWGSRVYRNSYFHGAYFDVTLVCTSDRIVTFLQPLDDKYQLASAYYQSRGLTDREFEIMTLIVKGVSNPKICQSLSISRATLRTHLNNVYRKCRELGEMPKFVPANRQQFDRSDNETAESWR